MNTKLASVLFLSVATCSFPVFGQLWAADATAIDKAIDFLKTACASGDSLTIEAEASGDINVLNKGGKATMKLTQKDARGIVDNLTNEYLRDDLKNQRECMRPYIHRILDVILDHVERKTTNFPLPKGFSLDNEGFILRPDGKRICRTETITTQSRGFGNVIGTQAWLKDECQLFNGTWAPQN